ncbi:colicin Z C-terminal domain-related protein [Stappia sp. ES.058]|uniref:colicin Z C-terminal domain-related protein n=1 Tax=Stappia sp. ES.058 TaxID=1881061 RepID=UPI00087A215F|nr:colicin Z C-terminal domain-related protein [Stappia sp. ES.058]SDU12992.1 hypothetical protein SAMN05428979_1801 [Stappia sp. ES.058]
MDEFFGATVGSALRSCLEAKYPREACTHNQKQPTESKGRGGSLAAPPGNWGPWETVFDRVAGPARTLRIDFKTTTETPSTFSVEIQGGNGQNFERLGPGSATVRLTENTTTEIRMRARSHGIIAQRILVSII